jgi:hypothetical protein
MRKQVELTLLLLDSVCQSVDHVRLIARQAIVCFIMAGALSAELRHDR